METAFEPIDLALADALLRLGSTSDEELREAIRLLSFHTRGGHVCIDLRDLPTNGPGGRASFPLRFIRALSKSSLVGSDRHRTTPLVLAGESRLYLRRMREYELLTASMLRNLALPVTAKADLGAEQRGGSEREALTEGQSESDPVSRALSVIRERRLVVITGGPGTGKTTLTAAILADLLRADPTARIALAAPTGKAGARLGESLAVAFGRLANKGAAALPVPPVLTLHRLLGRRMHSAGFKHDRDNPLECDILVIDEASMVDLPLFAGVLAALPAHGRLILAGDRYQLASIEAGTVLGDLCSVTEAPGRGGSLFGEADELARSIIELEQNFRFGADSGIGALAGLVRRGDSALALELLERGAPDLEYIPDSTSAEDALETAIAHGYRGLGQAQDPAACLRALQDFRILCAHRRGSGGVEELNALAGRVLLRTGTLRKVAGGIGGLEPLPILVTRNDHRLRLFNGDLGVLLHDADGRPSVYFSEQGSDELRRLPPERLPEHELSFATTVHKSQGSEFDGALLVLPSEASPVLTRELVYTAVTRARRRFILRGTGPVFQAAVDAAIQRTSGLRRALLSGAE